jgi:leucyl/phenylalanyl-tRNA--protein transferase
MIPWLARGQSFPAVDQALKSPNGLLAASRGIDAEQLESAYGQGIFPWYAEGEPVLWWSPDPRMVLHADEFQFSRSLAKASRNAIRNERLEIRVDSAFDAVMRACAEPRRSETGTWITTAVIEAYGDLHRRGLAHSIETWIEGALAGGLYLVALGRMFYGESMFARTTNASKLALVALIRLMRLERVPVIDCQQNTRHLASLGAREISRTEFISHVGQATTKPPVDWGAYAHRPLRSLLLAADSNDG